MEIRPIAHIRTNFPQKFGIPRQSGLVENEGLIVFEPEFSDPSCVRGIEGYDYLWLIWRFDHGEKNTWSPTVRPPILGGNKRAGVFATRSPFRPNPLGLSSVRLESVEMVDGAPVLHVRGADLRDGTEIYDIKPYLPYVDSHDDARGGISEARVWREFAVEFSETLPPPPCLSADDLREVSAALALDPRPAPHHDPERVYSMAFKDWDIDFTVDDDAGVLRVIAIRAR